MSDTTEQDRLLSEAKDAYRGKTDEQLIDAHLMLGLPGFELPTGKRDQFFQWLACSELLKERGYKFDERYVLWSRDENAG